MINVTSLYSAARREQKKCKRNSKTDGLQTELKNKQKSINPVSTFSDPGAMPSSVDNLTEM
jgi:hypothetical protein